MSKIANLLQNLNEIRQVRKPGKNDTGLKFVSSRIPSSPDQQTKIKAASKEIVIAHTNDIPANEHADFSLRLAHALASKLIKRNEENPLRVWGMNQTQGVQRADSHKTERKNADASTGLFFVDEKDFSSAFLDSTESEKSGWCLLDLSSLPDSESCRMFSLFDGGVLIVSENQKDSVNSAVRFLCACLKERIMIEPELLENIDIKKWLGHEGFGNTKKSASIPSLWDLILCLEKKNQLKYSERLQEISAGFRPRVILNDVTSYPAALSQINGLKSNLQALLGLRVDYLGPCFKQEYEDRLEQNGQGESTTPFCLASIAERLLEGQTKPASFAHSEIHPLREKNLV